MGKYNLMNDLPMSLSENVTQVMKDNSNTDTRQKKI
jgi:hypothetical protein